MGSAFGFSGGWRECDVVSEAGAAEVDEGDERVGGVEAEGAVADQADLAVEALEAAVGEAEADGGEDAVAVLAQGAREADERLQPGARWPRPARRRGASGASAGSGRW